MSGFHVLRVGVEDVGCRGADVGGHCGECGRARLRPGLGHGGGRGARSLAHREHGSGEGGVVCSERQLDRHGGVSINARPRGKAFWLSGSGFRQTP